MLIYKIVIWICNNIDLLDCKLNSDCIHSPILLGLLLRLDHPRALALPAERENIIGAFFLTAVKSQFASTQSIVHMVFLEPLGVTTLTSILPHKNN